MRAKTDMAFLRSFRLKSRLSCPLPLAGARETPEIAGRLPKLARLARRWTLRLGLGKIQAHARQRSGRNASMLTLFYSPGACSMASHIGLEESGAQYELKPVALAKGEQRSPEYLKVNPRGKVPALRLDDGSVLIENTAILTYLARRFPEKGLLPKDNAAEARCISMMAWLSNTVHPAFTHIFRPERFSEDQNAVPSIKETGKKTFWAA